MNAKRKIMALILALGMTAGMAAVTTMAAESTVIVEESFDDYDDQYEGSQTLLSPTFVMEANSIGDGFIKVLENPETGNLHLQSHVFTQIYNATPIESGYTFSIDIFETQGQYNCGLFLRAPMTDTAYYEADGYEGTSCCRTGVVLYFRKDALEVNIKNFDKTCGSTNFIGHNIFSFDLPDGVHFNSGEYVNLKVVDERTGMKIYVEDTLMCSISFSDPNKRGYSRVNVSEPCYQKAVIYDAAGTELGTIADPLVQAGGATVGWATRVANMTVDNVYLAADPLPETEPVTEPVTDAPIPETDAPTTPETDAPTQPVESEISSETDTLTTPADDDTTAGTTVGSTTADTTVGTDAPARDKGCFGTIAISGLATLLGAAFVALRKRN